MRNSDALQRKFDQVVRTGEVPYQANRRALKILDILDDGKGGLHEVDITLRGLEMLIDDLGDLRNEARKIERSSLAQLKKASGGISELPAYGKLRSVPDFKAIAVSFATMRKAIGEMRKTEDFLLRGNVLKEDLKKGLDDIAYFARVVVIQATKAIGQAQQMAKKIAMYERELIDAVN